MSDLCVLRSTDRAAWRDVLNCCTGYDSYHLPEYHAVAESNGQGDAHLFVYRHGPVVVALPLLLRTIDDVPGAEHVGPGYQDATSVYGYAGPVTSHPELPATIVASFARKIEAELRERRVVSAFSRLHPLLAQEHLLAGCGRFGSQRQTVSLDLTVPELDQLAQYRRNHHDGIRRLRKQGAICVRDDAGIFLEDFIAIYHGTMERHGASATYFYEADYYRSLMADGIGASLFVCRFHEQSICAALILRCQGILQYHLGGTVEEYIRLAPMKLLVDAVRAWGTAEGYRVLHLGGGTSNQPDDSLLHFKKGFSDRRHHFSAWRWILFPDVYERLCGARDSLDQKQGVPVQTDDYFPAYRRPFVERESKVMTPAPTARIFR